MSHKTSATVDAPSLPQGPESTPTPERLYTTPETAKLLRCGVRTVCNFVARNQLKASWVGRQWLFSASNIEAFVKDQEQDFTQSK
jgi:excisionase family DNA binding protein